jgi:UDP-2,4-diacetamido-2,4,6-trideoxy-beta-L-altropyranose hydrolase
MRAAGLSELLIRADAGTDIGVGHLMRCMALGQRWEAEDGNVTFVTACQSDSLRRRLSDEGFHVITLQKPYPASVDWELTAHALSAHPNAWVVLDGYHFDRTYQFQVKETKHPLLVVDDTAHLGYYHADVILNQNINAELLDYSCEPHTRFLLGTRYVLLRSEFLRWRSWRRESPRTATRILLTLGGGDPWNQTLKVIRCLQQTCLDDLDVTVVVGASNPHLESLESASKGSEFPLRLVCNPPDMPELMAWADVAVSGGGSTCWELAFMGLPTVVLVLAENQRGIADGLNGLGAVMSLGWYEEVSPGELADTLTRIILDQELRRRMSQRCRTLVDGMGTQRVVECLRRYPPLQRMAH